MTPKGLHGKIRSLLKMMGEIIYDDTHILNISEEEEIDHFSTVHYRVYHSNQDCFDVIQEYDSGAERGAGGLTYNFLPCIWDGYKNLPPMSIEKAYKIVDDAFNRNKNGKAFDVVEYRRIKQKTNHNTP